MGGGAEISQGCTVPGGKQVHTDLDRGQFSFNCIVAKVRVYQSMQTVRSVQMYKFISLNNSALCARVAQVVRARH